MNRLELGANVIVILIHRAGGIVQGAMSGVIVTTSASAIVTTHRHCHRVVSTIVQAAGVAQAAVTKTTGSGRSTGDRGLARGGVRRAVQAQGTSKQARGLVLAETTEAHLRMKYGKKDDA